MSGSIRQEEKEPPNHHWECYWKIYSKTWESKISTSKLGSCFKRGGFKNSPSLSMQLSSCGQWTYSK